MKALGPVGEPSFYNIEAIGLFVFSKLNKSVTQYYNLCVSQFEVEYLK